MRLFLKENPESEVIWDASIAVLRMLTKKAKKSSFVSLYDVLDDDTSKSIVLSQLGLMTLGEMLEENPEACTYQFARHAITELVTMVNQLHGRRVIHRSISVEAVGISPSKSKAGAYKLAKLG